MARQGQKIQALRLHLLVLRCQTGDENAFADLYNHFAASTLRYLTGLLDATTAHDVQQDVWLTVYRKIATLAKPQGFRTWLYQVTRHRALDYVRRHKRESALFEPMPAEAPLLEVSEELEDRLFPSLTSTRLAKAMAALSSIHRDVLLLRFWENMRYEEIALVLGCSVGTVRSRLHHAKHKVKIALETHDSEANP